MTLDLDRCGSCLTASYAGYLGEVFAVEKHLLVERRLPAATRWLIQACSGRFIATADASKVFMVGGND